MAAFSYLDIAAKYTLVSPPSTADSTSNSFDHLHLPKGINRGAGSSPLIRGQHYTF